MITNESGRRAANATAVSGSLSKTPSDRVDADAYSEFYRHG